jgi:hypothetical protein
MLKLELDFFFFETVSCYVAQAVLKLGLSLQVLGIIDLSPVDLELSLSSYIAIDSYR